MKLTLFKNDSKFRIFGLQNVKKFQKLWFSPSVQWRFGWLHHSWRSSLHWQANICLNDNGVEDASEYVAFIIGLFKVDHERSYFIYKCAKRAYKYSEHSTTYCFDRGFNQDQEHESTVAVICGQPQTCIRTCCKETQYLSSEGSCTNYQNQPENWITDFTEEATVFQSIPCTHGYFENLTK